MIQMSLLLFIKMFYNTASGRLIEVGRSIKVQRKLEYLLQKHHLILKQTRGHKRYNAGPRKAPPFSGRALHVILKFKINQLQGSFRRYQFLLLQPIMSSITATFG